MDVPTILLMISVVPLLVAFIERISAQDQEQYRIAEAKAAKAVEKPVEPVAGFAAIGDTDELLRERERERLDWWEQQFEIETGAKPFRDDYQKCLNLYNEECKKIQQKDRADRDIVRQAYYGSMYSTMSYENFDKSMRKVDNLTKIRQEKAIEISNAGEQSLRMYNRIMGNPVELREPPTFKYVMPYESQLAYEPPRAIAIC